MSKIALITGITGQDGSYLAELLLSKDYEVHGIVRRSSNLNSDRIPQPKSIRFHYGDLADSSNLHKIIRLVKPDEIYNLAAQSHVGISFEQSVYTGDIVYLGALRMLEAIREYRDEYHVHPKFYQASSSEMFGKNNWAPQSEVTLFRPCSPYAVAKVAAHTTSVNFRETYGIHTCCGILFNHESPRRGTNFVTRKITKAAARIFHGLQDKLVLGELHPKRDWGFAGDYVEAMWLMMQNEKPDDYVIATGKTHTVKYFLERVFNSIERHYEDFVEFDERFSRPEEVQILQGDASKARRILGWESKTSIDGLVSLMLNHDLDLAEREAHYANNSLRKGKNICLN
jgi:GDPmannose 4,6-dehydratase